MLWKSGIREIGESLLNFGATIYLVACRNLVNQYQLRAAAGWD